VSGGTLPLSGSTHIGIVEGDGEQVVPIATLRRRFAVHALIRLHSADFALLSVQSRLFVNFNLEITLNEVGRRYAVVPIIRAGKRLPDGQEVLPTIDTSRARLGICTDVIQRLAIEDVKAEHFAYSLPNIRNPEQLRAALLQRYAKMFPDLSNDEIVRRGCAVTEIAFDDR
jgi:hypothetical protein